MSPLPAAADPAFNLLGETLAARFAVERQVAEGGFAVVYRAREVDGNGLVALKVLKAPRGSAAMGPTAFQRAFESEARITAALKHQHIVQLRAFGVLHRAPDLSLPWMALEWLEGQTLEAWLGRRRADRLPVLTPADALALMRPVIDAIAFAHARGVIHCDLKPSNIFLVDVARGDAPAPKVLDFGIARIMAPAAEDAVASGHTTRDRPAFSPAYAAPEQVSYGRTGPGTDVHALGLILSELLTDCPPYQASDPEQRFEEVIAERRPTPAARGVDVGEWEAVLARALGRRPADRFADAASLLRALDGAADLEQRPGRLTLAIRTPPTPTRRLAMMGAVIGVLAAGAAGLALRFGAGTPAPGPRTRTRSAHPLAYEAYLRGVQLKDRLDRQAFQQAVTHFQQAVTLDPGYAAAHAALAESYQNPFITGRPRDIQPLARAAAVRAVELDDQLSDAHAALGTVLLRYDWDWRGAQRHFLRAMKLDPDRMDIRRRYAQLLMAAGRTAQAVAERERALELAPLSLAANALLGIAYVNDRRYLDGIARLSRAVEIDPRQGGPHYYLATAYAHAGRHEEALAELQKATSEAPWLRLAMAGYVHARAGRPQAAEGILTEMRALAAREYVTPSEFARVYVGLDRFDEALAWLETGYRERDFTLCWLRAAPVWDPLRSDPRFQDLIRRVGMPDGG